MRTLITALVLGLTLLMARLVNGETFFGPGVISIATNEAIMVSTLFPYSNFTLLVDGSLIRYGTTDFVQSPRYAIAGPRTIELTDKSFLTFQRLRGSAVKTILTVGVSTNVIDVPAGRTIQFFAHLGGASALGRISLPDSTNTYTLSLTGGNFVSASCPYWPPKHGVAHDYCGGIVAIELLFH